jgi:hypothetical protein
VFSFIILWFNSADLACYTKIEEQRWRGGLRAGEGRTAAGLGWGCWAEPRVRGGGPKVFINNQMSRIKYNYYINNISKQVQEIIDMQKGNNKVNKA